MARFLPPSGACGPTSAQGKSRANTTPVFWYTIIAMPARWGTAKISDEVREWLRTLERRQKGQAHFHIDLLADRGVHLGEPYTRQLRGKLRELRFTCGGERQRISYYIASERRIILLTVFHKTKRRERQEVERAARAMLAHVEDDQRVKEQEQQK